MSSFAGHGLRWSSSGGDADRPRKAALVDRGGQAVLGSREVISPVEVVLQNHLAAERRCLGCDCRLRMGNLSGRCAACAQKPPKKAAVDRRLETLRKFLATPNSELARRGMSS